jgi:hypothetical protein
MTVGVKNPESFGGLEAAKPSHPTPLLHIFPILGYFSLTTLSTIGFGDITPLTLQARYAAVAKASPASFIWRSWSRDWWEFR